MVHLFSRITRLLSRVAASKRLITETDLPLLDPSSSSNPVLDSSTATPTAHNTLGLLAGFGSGATDPLTIEARKLNADVDAWIESLQLTTLEHERVQVGNRAYAHAMKVSGVLPEPNLRNPHPLRRCERGKRWSRWGIGGTRGFALTTPADLAAEDGLHVPARGREGPGSRHGGAQALFHLDSPSRHVDRVSRPRN